MLAEDLDRWRKGEAILARPSTAWERTRRWTRRNPEIAALATGLILTIVAGLLATVFMWHRARQTAASGEHLLYVASMKSAQTAWEQNNVGLVRQLLEETQNSPHGFRMVLLAAANSPRTKDISRTCRGGEFGGRFPRWPADCERQ